MQNILRTQLLHHAVGNKLVVLGGAQPLGDRLERPQKAGEILIFVQRARFFLAEDTAAVLKVFVAIIGAGKRGGMATAQFRQRQRINRALEVQVEFGLGQF